MVLPKVTLKTTSVARLDFTLGRDHAWLLMEDTNLW